MAAGLLILDGNARVRTPSGLVKLQELSGSGPQGPAGPQGPQGEPGVVDTSLVYTKAEVDGALLFKENRWQTGTQPGAKIWDGTLRQLRNVLGQHSVHTFIVTTNKTRTIPILAVLSCTGLPCKAAACPR